MEGRRFVKYFCLTLHFRVPRLERKKVEGGRAVKYFCSTLRFRILRSKRRKAEGGGQKVEELLTIFVKLYVSDF